MPRNPNCTNCDLHCGVKTVCVWGEGPQTADIMFVGRDPGATEDEQGRPFVGQAGQVLDRWIELAGLRREDVYITNINKCRPPNNRPPTNEEKAACRAYLDEEIKTVNPKVIVCLGGGAFEAITGRTGIMSYAGSAVAQDGRKIFASVHPSYVLRNQRYAETAEDHFKGFNFVVDDIKQETQKQACVVVVTKNPNNLAGPSIHIFDNLLNCAKLSRANVQFIGLGQVPPDKLLGTVAGYAPDVVVTFGGDALNAIVGGTNNVMQLAGKPINVEKSSVKFIVIPTVSLAYLERDPSYQIRAQKHWEDIGRVARGGSIERPKAPTNYVYIQDIEKARALFKRMTKCKEISFDLETSEFNFQTGKILCWSFSWQKHTAVVLPIHGQFLEEVWTPTEKQEIEDNLRNLFQNPEIEWIAHNISFDEKFLIQRGIHIIGEIHDTMLLSTLIDENARDLKGLKPLAELYTDLGDYDAPLEAFKTKLKATKVLEHNAQGKALRAEIKKIQKFLTKGLSPDEARDLKSKLIGLEYELEEHKTEDVDISYAEIPTDILWPYAAMDADATFRIFNEFYHKRLRQISDQLVKPFGRSMVKLYRKLEMPLRKVLNGMEFRGAQIDIPYLQDLDRRYTEQTTQMEQELFAMPEIKTVEKWLWKGAAIKIGERYDKLKKPPGGISREAYVKKYTKPVSFNMNSPAHLRTLLYDVLNAPEIKRTPTGNLSTDKEVLEQLADGEFHPVITKFQESRKLQKLHMTYVKGMQRRADSNGRVHTDFNQHITVTGRLSSSNPNLQNIPRANKDIKKAFITQPGWSIVQADYSQAEFRFWGQLSQDPDMIRDIAAGMDIHRVTASEFWGILEEEVPKELRTAAKFVVFGLMYGRGAKSVARQVKIQEKEAEQIIEHFFEKYPVAARWLHATRQFAQVHGYVWNHFGRVRRLPHANSPDREKVAEAMRQAVNAPIQGSAADMTGIALIRIQKELTKRNLKARLILTVHDSIVLECPDEELLEVTTLCHDCMTAPIGGINVPMDCEIEVGKNWGEVEEWPNGKYEECFEKYLAAA